MRYLNINKSRAFSLLEVILVLTICSVLFGVARVGTHAYRQRLERKDVAMFVRVVQSAQKQAILLKKNVRIYHGGEKGSICMDAGEGVKTFRLKSGLEWEQFPEFVFTPSGAPRMAGTILLKGEKKSYRCTISVATGRVKVYEEKE